MNYSSIQNEKGFSVSEKQRNFTLSEDTKRGGGWSQVEPPSTHGLTAKQRVGEEKGGDYLPPAIQPFIYHILEGKRGQAAR